MVHKIAICDDDIFFSRDLKDTIEKIAAQQFLEVEIDLIESAEDLYYALKGDEIDKAKKYELIILDIYFRGLDKDGMTIVDKSSEYGFDIVYGTEGTDIAVKIRDELDIYTPIVFVSISREIKHGTMISKIPESYIVEKPLTASQVRRILDIHFKKKEIINRIFTYRKDRNVESIELKKVMYFEGSGNHVIMHTDTGETEVINAKLKNLENELIMYNFCFCHRSFLVNAIFIKTFPDRVVLKNDEVLPLTKKYLFDIAKAFENVNVRKSIPIEGHFVPDGRHLGL